MRSRWACVPGVAEALDPADDHRLVGLDPGPGGRRIAVDDGQDGVGRHGPSELREQHRRIHPVEAGAGHDQVDGSVEACVLGPALQPMDI